FSVLAVLGAGWLVLHELRHRRNAEQRIVSRDALLLEQAQLLDFANVMLREVDGRIRLWNAGATRLYGWSRQEAEGHVSHDLLQTEFPAPIEDINRQLDALGVWQGRLRHRRKDGTHVIVHSQWLMHRGVSGQPSVLEINSDITEQRRAEDLAAA